MMGYARAFHTGGVAQDFKDFSPVTTLGLPQYILTSGYLATPNITLGNGYQAVSSQGPGFADLLHSLIPLDTWDLSANLDKIHGQHEFKFGWEGRLHRISFLQWPRLSRRTIQLHRFPHFADSGLHGWRSVGIALDRLPTRRQRLRRGCRHFHAKLCPCLGFQDAAGPASPSTWRPCRGPSAITAELDRPHASRPCKFPYCTAASYSRTVTSARPYNLDPMNFGPRRPIARPVSRLRTGYGIFYDPIKGAASVPAAAASPASQYATAPDRAERWRHALGESRIRCLPAAVAARWDIQRPPAHLEQHAILRLGILAYSVNSGNVLVDVGTNTHLYFGGAELELPGRLGGE